MRNSHSAAPLLLTNADKAEPGVATRIQRRSSLDTFVIPGRTRLPSSKVSQPEPMDVQIAQGLLNPHSLGVPKKHSHRADRPGWLAPKSKKSPIAKGKPRSNEETSVSTSTRKLMSKPKKKPVRFASRETMVDPQHNRLPQHQDSVPPSRETWLQTSQDDPINRADGPQSEGSRVTSTTWSTISHRIFSNSSGGSQNRGSSKPVEEYNAIALKHGLPQFALSPEITGPGMSAVVP